jgi:hypothetical protein
MDIETDAYIEDCMELERNSIFDMELFLKYNPNFDLYTNDWTYDIPESERVFEVSVPRDEHTIEAIEARIKECREYIKSNPQYFLGQ